MLQKETKFDGILKNTTITTWNFTWHMTQWLVFEFLGSFFINPMYN